MFEGCTSSEGKSYIEFCTNEIDYAVYLIEKNYNDMDIKNVNIKKEYREITKEMEKICKNLSSSLKNIRFE